MSLAELRERLSARRAELQHDLEVLPEIERLQQRIAIDLFELHVNQ